MNIGFWLCGVLVILFVIIGVLFAIFKEKAAKFVSGFNSLPKEEQALYDKAHISRDIKMCIRDRGCRRVLLYSENYSAYIKRYP